MPKRLQCMNEASSAHSGTEREREEEEKSKQRGLFCSFISRHARMYDPYHSLCLYDLFEVFDERRIEYIHSTISHSLEALSDLHSQCTFVLWHSLRRRCRRCCCCCMFLPPSHFFTVIVFSACDDMHVRRIGIISVIVVVVVHIRISSSSYSYFLRCLCPLSLRGGPRRRLRMHVHTHTRTLALSHP